MKLWPNIRAIPIEDNRFTTLGDWYENPNGSFEITVTIMDDWRHMFCVLIHEMIEWAVCQRDQVRTADCDAFDAEWERGIEAGIHPIEVEAGFDRACPYRRGHVWGCRMEHLFCFILGCNWKSYCTACDRMIERYAAR